VNISINAVRPYGFGLPNESQKAFETIQNATSIIRDGGNTMKSPDFTQIDDQFCYQFSVKALATFWVVVVASYHIRLQVLNSGQCYQNEQYRIRRELEPGLIRLAIQDNIEGELIAEYDSEQSSINSAEMLSAMIGETKLLVRPGGLSVLGETVMDEMFNSLAGMAYAARPRGQSITANISFPVH